MPISVSSVLGDGELERSVLGNNLVPDELDTSCPQSPELGSTPTSVGCEGATPQATLAVRPEGLG